MSEAKSLAAFTRSAVDFDVAESDFLVLLDSKISNYESMAYRLPISKDLEEYLRKTLRVRGAYRDQDGAIILYNKRDVAPWEDYKTSEDAGCLRKLWGFALQMAKKELESLASPGEESHHKVTLTTAYEWETRAVEEGMPIPLSDRERPSLYCLGKVQAAYSTGGTYQYLTWETFVDAEHEGRLRRQGKLPKEKEVVVAGTKLNIKKETEDIELNLHIDDATDVREVLEIRARAFHMAKVCDFETCRKITERFLSKLRATQVVGMRGPTINEVRRADREIFHEVLGKAAKGSGSIQTGLEFFLKTPDHHLWKLLDPQIKSMPDQGLEQKVRPEKRKREASPDPKPEKKRGESPTSPKARMCIVCGQRHEPRCELPANFRRDQRAKNKAKRDAQAKKASAKKGSDSKGGAPKGGRDAA